MRQKERQTERKILDTKKKKVGNQPWNLFLRGRDETLNKEKRKIAEQYKEIQTKQKKKKNGTKEIKDNGTNKRKEETRKHLQTYFEGCLLACRANCFSFNRQRMVTKKEKSKNVEGLRNRNYKVVSQNEK
jgi:hypothetical protein